MEKTILISIPVQDLQSLIIDCINCCLKYHEPKPIEPKTQWFDIDALCHYLPEKPSKATIYAKTSKGEIPHYKDGKHLRFLKSDIDEYLKLGRVKTNSEVEKEATDFLLNSAKGGGSHV